MSRDKNLPGTHVSRATIERRPGLLSCSNCGKPFKKGEWFVVEETPTNWFRGDDEVRAYHEKCGGAQS